MAATLENPQSNSEEDDGRAAKRKKLTIRHGQPQHATEAANAIEESAAHSMLARSIGHLLKNAGFEGADPVALESFCAAADEFLLGIASSVHRSMLASRRTQPIPQDFVYALGRAGVGYTALEPYLDIRVPTSVSSPTLQGEEPAQNLFASNLALSVPSDAPLDSSSQHYPKHLPPLPGKHTYKATAAFTEREHDPRVIREKATEEGRLGGEALQRLASRRKAAKEPTKVLTKEEQLWQSTLEALNEQEDRMSLGNGLQH